MSTGALVMMAFAIVVIWGGLAWAVSRLYRFPEGSVRLLDDDGRPVEGYAELV
ncbi:methionine/alanine import family NSS transporter small subunit [Luteococcus peritonei]|uniref:Methionine/alanine import family NSS transporter small subunit n=1 Tax=Luteococcus peritonei TaxID=88874 RepID=A0ABW4RVV0_9ACTN